MRAALLLGALCTRAASAQSATRLRVEYLDAPITIDEPLPRFSFALSHPDRGVTLQSYQITVTDVSPVSSAQLMWDSGRVVANSSLNIEYRGIKLTSDSDYAWTATWWSNSSSAPSSTARSTFSTALLDGAGGAQWIAPAAGNNLLRAEFSVAGAPVRARLYVSGLGYYRSFLNGLATDAHVMGSFTVFEKRILYDVWDVTPLVKEGCNALGVALGRGWYNQSSIKSGPISLWALLTVDTADGKRASFSTSTAGGAWSSAQGPVVADEIYLGEHFDARLVQPGWNECGFANASAWQPATPTRDATQNASFNAHALSVVTDVELPAVSVSEPQNGVFVVDFGRNMAGITTVRAVCPDGPQTIRIDYAETLKDDGTILQFYTYPYPLIMTSNFTCSGTGELEEYTTLFSQYGFQYAQITNFPGTPSLASMTAFTVNAAVGQGSAIVTSNALINRIQLATRAASISNLNDVPTDCPQRERRGWLGDGQLTFETVIHNFDAAAYYTKWLRDIADAQFDDGRLGDTAPFYNHGGLPADPAWSAAYPLITLWCSSYFSDQRLIARHYSGIRNFVEWQLQVLGPNGLLPVNKNVSQGAYGDWCSVSTGFNTSCHFARVGLSTYFFVKGVEALASFAATLGNAADAARYSALAASTKTTFHALLWNSTHSFYEDGFPVSQLAALDIGGISASARSGAFTALVAELETGALSGFPRSPSGGIIFQKLAYPQLDAGGRFDLAIDLLLARGMPSIAYWFDDTIQTTPATTLWERWTSTATKPLGSFNHVMYAGYGSWLFQALGGVGRAVGSLSWSALDIRPPQVLPSSYNLSSASTTLDTALGIAEVDWRATNASTMLCGRVEENAAKPNGTSLSFECTGGVFSAVAFASFGTPIGDSCPFAVDPDCDSNASVAVVESLCVGKSACVIPARVSDFGDPCAHVQKSLAVQLVGSCAAPVFSLQARVPTGGTATLRIPIGARAPADVNVTESGFTVWSNGAFEPSDGVTGAAAADGYISFSIGSGIYDFALLA